MEHAQNNLKYNHNDSIANPNNLTMHQTLEMAYDLMNEEANVSPPLGRSL